MPSDNLNEPVLPRSNRTPFEWSLSALQPNAEPANSPAILFQAGRSSRDGEVKILKIFCGIAALLAVSLVLLTLSLLGSEEEPGTAQPPTTPTTAVSQDPAGSMPGSGYSGVQQVSSNEQFQFVAPVRPWRTLEQPHTELPTATETKEIVEALFYRRSLLNTGLGLLPTEGPDLTPTHQPTTEK